MTYTLLRTRLVTLPKPPRRRRCMCLCECGNKFFAWAHHLASGNTKSCGCLRASVAKTKAPRIGAQPHRPVTRPTKYAEGYSVLGHPLRSIYSRWTTMKRRCEDPNHTAYPHYGGRGIRVCLRWKNFENFVIDMGLPPEGTSIDRIDNDGNYEPSNCRWATRKEQEANKG